jgi:hypothetical protein
VRHLFFHCVIPQIPGVETAGSTAGGRRWFSVTVDGFDTLTEPMATVFPTSACWKETTFPLDIFGTRFQRWLWRSASARALITAIHSYRCFFDYTWVSAMKKKVYMSHQNCSIYVKLFPRLLPLPIGFCPQGAKRSMSKDSSGAADGWEFMAWKRSVEPLSTCKKSAGLGPSGALWGPVNGAWCLVLGACRCWENNPFPPKKALRVTLWWMWDKNTYDWEHLGGV